VYTNLVQLASWPGENSIRPDPREMLAED
jgi:hypothetical protein